MTATAKARRIEYVNVDDVPPAPLNAKTHDHGLLESSMARWGFTEPVVVDERTGLLVAGHGRVEQLKRLRDNGRPPPDGVELNGEEWRVPVVRGWSSKDDREAAAYVIASNRTTERGGWDQEALAGALQGLEGAFNGVGFDQGDLDALLARMDDTGPEEPPPDTSEQLGGLMYRLIIECNGESHQRDLLVRLEAEGLTVSPVVN